MAVNAYINFRGNCREALEFYTDVFGAQKPDIMTYGEQDHAFPITEEAKNLVLHAELNFMGGKVMFSDVMDNMPFVVGNNICLTVVSDNQQALQTAFAKLKVGGQVIMDLQETFWSGLYGYLIDRFGIGWQLSHEAAKQSTDYPTDDAMEGAY